MRKLSIAIDGPAGAGKSSVSKILAARLGYAYLDTGAMYRAVTYEVLSKGIFDEIEIVLMINKIDMEVKPDKDAMLVFVDGEDVTPFLRTADVSAHVSWVSAMAGVRRAMVKIQRKQAEKGGIVLDGRDIGTTVLPNADVKIFLTASAHTRAIRRCMELAAAGQDVTPEGIEEDIEKRDYQDSHRAVSPLRQADDAVLLDNGDLTLEETADAIISNHKSYWDPPMIGVAFKTRIVHFMAKEELFKNPVFGWVIRQLGTFPVRRGVTDRAAIRQAVKVLKDGYPLGIFPEGTRIRREGLGKFHSGMASLALMTGTPILPVAIVGSMHMPKWSAHPAVLIGKPIPVKKEKATEEKIEALNELVKKEILTMAEEYKARFQKH